MKAGGQAEFGGDEGLAKTGNQLFKGIGLVAKAFAELSLQPVLGAGCMNAFMCTR